MKIKSIDTTEKYFMGSFRYNRSKPEDFGLKKVEGKDHFVDKEGNLWQNEILWDSGWGNEYGFVRLPEPNFEQLWVLLTESNIEVNKLGAAELLTQYPDELKEKLQKLFKQNEKIGCDLTKRLTRLDLLNHVMNHSEVKGKKPEEVDADYREWKKLKDDFDLLKTIAKNDSNSLWEKIKSIFSF